METRSVSETSVDLSHQIYLSAREGSVEPCCCGNAKTCFFSCHPTFIFTLYCLSFSFTYFLFQPQWLCCFLTIFFVLCVVLFVFLCTFFFVLCAFVSFPHFSPFHHLLFIFPLMVYFCFLTSRRLDSVSHSDCGCMFSGM